MGKIREVVLKVNDYTRNIVYEIYPINRKFTIILGDSASGKTDLCNTVKYIKNNKDDKNYKVDISETQISGLSFENSNSIEFDVNVLEDRDDYLHIIKNSKNTIFLLDDSCKIPNNIDFRDAILESTNYAIIMRRKKLVPYQISIYAMYELETRKNVIKSTLAYFVSDHTSEDILFKDDNTMALTEDSEDGLKLLEKVIPGITTSNGNYNIKNCINTSTRVVFIDAEAGGNYIQEIEEIRHSGIYKFALVAPLSFEHALLKAIRYGKYLQEKFKDTYDRLFNYDAQYAFPYNSIDYNKTCQSVEQFFKEVYKSVVCEDVVNANYNDTKELIKSMYTRKE